jgi:hypothetical protein
MPGEPGGHARRTRVTSPRTSAGRSRRVNVPSEIDAQTRLGELYMTSLLRAQLRLAVRVLGLLAVLVGGLPLLFWMLPDLGGLRVLRMPLAWGLLAFAVYPVMLALAWYYVRAAERNERDFTDVVDES